MRHSSGAKIVIARTSARHWVYFNVHGDKCDSGSIIDFVQARNRLSLGEVRKELRPWVGEANLVRKQGKANRRFQLELAEHDAAKVVAAWMNAQRISGPQAYLSDERRLPLSVLFDPIFSDRIRVDSQANILFPHWNSKGDQSGFEIKNRQFTGFAAGGVKGLWCSRPCPDDQVMVLAETAIDALSVAALLGTDKKRFFSTAGQISPAQSVCIRSAVSRLPINAEIWLAFDNDSGGQKLVQQVTDALAELSDNQRKVVVSLPPTVGDDWNDVLRNGTCPDLPRFEND